MRAGIFTVILILAYMFLKDILSGVGSASSLIYVALMVLLMMPLLFLGERLKNKDRTVEYKKRTENTVNELITTGILSNVSTPNSFAQSIEQQTAQEVIDDLTVFLRPFAADQVEVRNPDLDGAAATWIPLYKFVLPSAVTLDDGLRYALPASSKLAVC